MSDLRRCSKCGEEKIVEGNFRRIPARHGFRLHSWCKECLRKADLAIYNTSHDKQVRMEYIRSGRHAEITRRWYRKHATEIKLRRSKKEESGRLMSREERIARNWVRSEIKAGRMPARPKACSMCKNVQRGKRPVMLHMHFRKGCRTPQERRDVWYACAVCSAKHRAKQPKIKTELERIQAGGITPAEKSAAAILQKIEDGTIHSNHRLSLIPPRDSYVTIQSINATMRMVAREQDEHPTGDVQATTVEITPETAAQLQRVKDVFSSISRNELAGLWRKYQRMVRTPNE